MKAFLGLALLVFVIMAGWRIGNSLNSDAIGMAVGMFFGILAGIPTAILILLSTRRKERKNNQLSSHEQSSSHSKLEHNQQPHPQQLHPQQLHPQQPVIIVTGGQPSAQPGAQLNNSPQNSDWPHPQMPPERSLINQSQQERKFRIVGESEEWLDEW